VLLFENGKIKKRLDGIAGVGLKEKQLTDFSKMPQKFLLNINLPNLPLEKITGIEITRLGERSYMDNIKAGHDGKRKYYWIVRGKPDWKEVEGTDISALGKIAAKVRGSRTLGMEMRQSSAFIIVPLVP
jgi:broad specificity polyphosphatase/5'/3'-nucleotidase SurE